MSLRVAPAGRATVAEVVPEATEATEPDVVLPEEEEEEEEKEDGVATAAWATMVEVAAEEGATVEVTVEASTVITEVASEIT